MATMAANHGGFSQKEESGNWGHGGAYASWQDYEKVIDGPLRTTDVTNYRRQHQDQLAAPGAYLGGYREPAGTRQKSPGRLGDEVYLDVSRRFIGRGRLERAKEFARGQGQVSVFDTDQGLAYVHESPDVPEPDKYTYSAHMADAVRAQKLARSASVGSERQSRVGEMTDALFAAQNLKPDPNGPSKRPKTASDHEREGAEHQRVARGMPKGPERTKRVEQMVDSVFEAQRASRKGY